MLKTCIFYVCFVDFQKAFDHIWRLGMLYKLQINYIKGKFYDMIKNIYKETFVKSGHMQSNFLKTNLGVKQGEPWNQCCTMSS